MKSPPTALRHDSSSSSSTFSSTSSLSSFLLPDCASPYYYSAPSLPPLRLPEGMKRAVVGCAIALSTLQHASLLLSIELSSSSSSSPSPSTRSAASPLSLAVVLLLASTAVSVGTLGFLARTRRVWPSVLAFACHIDVLALTLALNYGIASEFFSWLAWVPVLLFLVGAPRCAFAAVCGLFLQGFAVHFITASTSASASAACSSAAAGHTIELTPGTKLVCCGLSLMAVGVIALVLYSPPPPRPTTPKLQLDQSPSSSSVAASVAPADPKVQLLAHIGQEIKAPLHGILSLAAQVVDSLPSRLWIEKECVRRIVDSGHVMLCIMDNLLDFPAISTSQLRLQNTLFSIVDEFNQVLSILKPSAFKKQITLESTIDVRYPQRFGDPKRFRQVLFNVASNAIKYSPEKGCVRLYLTNTRLNCNRIDVRVEDSGVGISSDLIPHLFELPHLDQSTKKSLPGGPGLSLAVSKLLCEAMNGYIECQSKAGKGSTFSFSVDIPMHEEAAQEYVRSRSSDSLSLRRKSEGAEPVVVDNKDALLASADRRWARRHSLATTSSSSSSSSSTSSPRKRRPNTQSLPQQTTRPRRQRANSLKSQAEPQGHDHSSSATSGPCPSSRSRRRHSNDNGDHNRDHNEACQAAPELDLYNNGGSGGPDQAGATQEVSTGAAPVRAKSEDELMANTTATSAAASEKAAATERRGGSVIVMSSSTGRRGDRALDKEQTKLQELYQGLQGTRVLLVEDNVVNQKVAKLMLTSLGCEVAIAGNGQIGLDLMAQRIHDGAGEAFDVVLMDLQMPVMDGFIASTRIRELERAEKRPRTPIVTLTASTTSEYQERCTGCGMDGWLSKPFSKEQLATVIATWTHKYPVATPPPSSSSSSSSESETPSSPEFSPPSDEGFDAVPAAQNGTVEPTTVNNAAGQADHPHDRPQPQKLQIKQLRAETAALPIPPSAEHLSSTHRFAAAAAERSSLLRSSSA